MFSARNRLIGGASEGAVLWPAAEALAGRPLDLLDPKILDRREAMNG
jgi:hypothetical protein